MASSDPTSVGAFQDNGEETSRRHIPSRTAVKSTTSSRWAIRRSPDSQQPDSFLSVYTKGLPSPNSEPHNRRGSKFTPDDAVFFIKFISWRLKADPTLSRAELGFAVGSESEAPHHSETSWSSYWSRNHDLPDKILASMRVEVDTEYDDEEPKQKKMKHNNSEYHRGEVHKSQIGRTGEAKGDPRFISLSQFPQQAVKLYGDSAPKQSGAKRKFGTEDVENGGVQPSQDEATRAAALPNLWSTRKDQWNEHPARMLQSYASSLSNMPPPDLSPDSATVLKPTLPVHALPIPAHGLPPPVAIVTRCSVCGVPTAQLCERTSCVLRRGLPKACVVPHVAYTGFPIFRIIGDWPSHRILCRSSNVTMLLAAKVYREDMIRLAPTLQKLRTEWTPGDVLKWAHLTDRTQSRYTARAVELNELFQKFWTRYLEPITLKKYWVQPVLEAVESGTLASDSNDTRKNDINSKVLAGTFPHLHSFTAAQNTTLLDLFSNPLWMSENGFRLATGAAILFAHGRPTPNLIGLLISRCLSWARPYHEIAHLLGCVALPMQQHYPEFVGSRLLDLALALLTRGATGEQFIPVIKAIAELAETSREAAAHLLPSMITHYHAGFVPSQTILRLSAVLEAPLAQPVMDRIRSSLASSATNGDIQSYHRELESFRDNPEVDSLSVEELRVLNTQALARLGRVTPWDQVL
ncbi:hypothetical protein DFH07DRAFT_785180 [Mycena maculata]|uniref:Uncharacterized protein n=1 Tax=Mycena maculata TaxID=230809 RepID=A0AAD7MHQ8_9AGAR|nr:hypothetical protein DFH07DRAFT_785180 [Mycena maculata]